MADEVLVMKDGAIVEQACADEILERPREAYTKRLIGAVPRGYAAVARAGAS
jgi:peptide/nickel transport system ATP-binding protein